MTPNEQVERPRRWTVFRFLDTPDGTPGKWAVTAEPAYAHPRAECVPVIEKQPVTDSLRGLVERLMELRADADEEAKRAKGANQSWATAYAHRADAYRESAEELRRLLTTLENPGPEEER
jgi:hypothetical protein